MKKSNEYLIIRSNSYELTDLDIYTCNSDKCLEYDGSDLFLVIDKKKMRFVIIHFDRLKISKNLLKEKIINKINIEVRYLELLEDLFYDFDLCI